jgi:ATP-dependent protease ClpP protease subunit
MGNTAELKEFTVDWDRSVMIRGQINESLVETLSPTILKFRQESAEPITIGIDSYGGSLPAMEVLLSLLRGPHQSNKRATIIGVAINNAFSAAASLLALSDYAVAFPHSTIIFHDVRYQGIEDVTPEKALSTAKQLTVANDEFSLKLAQRIVGRLVWLYIDLKKDFEESKSKFSTTTKKFEKAVGKYFPNTPENPFDMVGFAVTLYRRLSIGNDHIILDVFQNLRRWVEIADGADLVPILRAKGSRRPGLLDGVVELHKQLSKASNNAGAALEDKDKDTFRMLITLCVRFLSQRKTPTDTLDNYVDKLVDDYNFMRNMKNPRHVRDILRIMRLHSNIFFGAEFSQKIKDQPEEEIEKTLLSAIPKVRIFWYFCVLMCRALFSGEHRLTPLDAQLLGIVDEVVGSSKVESRREFLLSEEKEAQKR